MSDLSVIVPSFNEGAVIGLSLQRLKQTFDNEGISLRIVVVLDGPDQMAQQAIQELNYDCVLVCEFDEPRGKGAALRSGIAHSDSQFTAFFDADLDIHPNSLVSCFRMMQSSERDIVCAYGSKLHTESQIDYPAIRKICSKIFNFFVRRLFQVNCQDSQAGVKVFRTSEMKEVLHLTQEERFLFDLELLFHLKMRGAHFVDVPITVTYQYSSSIDLFAAAKIVLDLIRMRLRLYGVSKEQVLS